GKRSDSGRGQRGHSQPLGGLAASPHPAALAPGPGEVTLGTVPGGPVQRVVQLVLAHHSPPSAIPASTTAGISCLSRARALLAWLLTVPALVPSTSAICASDRSSK